MILRGQQRETRGDVGRARDIAGRARLIVQSADSPIARPKQSLTQTRHRSSYMAHVQNERLACKVRAVGMGVLKQAVTLRLGKYGDGEVGHLIRLGALCEGY